MIDNVFVGMTEDEAMAFALDFILAYAAQSEVEGNVLSEAAHQRLLDLVAGLEQQAQEAGLNIALFSEIK